ncbi:MAG: DUF2752 domain-containing protein [Planctomycetes bacterium]|nr:DUF2752 domain-containing protein [Planctomycetota bacterium]
MNEAGTRPGASTALYKAAAITALGAAMLAWGIFAPGKVTRECRMVTMTGLPCPLCGGTRAVAALVRGRPLEALRHHLIAAVMAPVLLAGGVMALVIRSGRDKILGGMYVFAGMSGWAWLIYYAGRLAVLLIGGHR